MRLIVFRSKKIIIVEPGASDGTDIWAQRMKKYSKTTV